MSSDICVASNPKRTGPAGRPHLRPRSPQRRVTRDAREPLQYDKLIRLSAGRLDALRPEIFHGPGRLSPAAVFAVCEHSVQFLDATAAFLSQICRAEVSLSAKFLWGREERAAPVLHTLFRSTNTRHIREAYAPRDNFGYAENSAFKALLEGWPKVTHFASDDLLREWMDGEYENSNSSWFSFYTSTAVSTIPCSGDLDQFPIGFLCADSLLAPLSSEGVRTTLNSAALHMYNLLGVLYSGRADVENNNNHKTKRSPPLNIRMPCGWKNSNGVLEPVSVDRQKEFQSILQRLEMVYRTHPNFTGGARSAFAGPWQTSGPLPLFEENAMYDEAELLALAKRSPEPAAKQWLAAHEHEDLTRDQIEAILREMAAYNPDAEEMLRRFNAR